MSSKVGTVRWISVLLHDRTVFLIWTAVLMSPSVFLFSFFFLLMLLKISSPGSSSNPVNVGPSYPFQLDYI